MLKKAERIAALAHRTCERSTNEQSVKRLLEQQAKELTQLTETEKNSTNKSPASLTWKRYHVYTPPLLNNRAHLSAAQQVAENELKFPSRNLTISAHKKYLFSPDEDSLAGPCAEDASIFQQNYWPPQIDLCARDFPPDLCEDSSLKMKLKTMGLLKRIPRRWQGTNFQPDLQHFDRNHDQGTLERASDVLLSAARGLIRKCANSSAVTSEIPPPAPRSNIKRVASLDSLPKLDIEVTESHDAPATDRGRGFGDTTKSFTSHNDIKQHSQDLHNFPSQINLSDDDYDDETPLAQIPIMFRAHAVPQVDLFGVQKVQEQLASLHTRTHSINTEKESAKHLTSLEQQAIMPIQNTTSSGEGGDEERRTSQRRETAAKQIFHKVTGSPSQQVQEVSNARKDAVGRGPSGSESLFSGVVRRENMQDNRQKVIQVPEPSCVNFFRILPKSGIELIFIVAGISHRFATCS